MTARRRLVPEREVESMHALLKRLGCKLDGPIEVGSDRVVFHPTPDSGGDAYERWSRENKDRD